MSANPKQRSEPIQHDAEKPVDTQRLLNVGKEIELSFGKFTVKELDVFSLISIASEGLEAFIDLKDTDGSDLALIKAIANDKTFQKKVAKILALFCGTDDSTNFEKLSVKDFMKLIATIKEVVDFDEIKEAFFALNLQKYLQPNTPNTTETK